MTAERDCEDGDAHCEDEDTHCEDEDTHGEEASLQQLTSKIFVLKPSIAKFVATKQRKELDCQA